MAKLKSPSLFGGIMLLTVQVGLTVLSRPNPLMLRDKITLIFQLISPLVGPLIQLFCLKKLFKVCITVLPLVIHTDSEIIFFTLTQD